MRRRIERRVALGPKASKGRGSPSTPVTYTCVDQSQMRELKNREQNPDEGTDS